MFKFRPNVVLRFNLLVIFAFTLAGIIIVGKAAIIMFFERDDWNKIKEENIRRDEPIEARRGNLLDDNGELIVSTLPKYRLLFDFKYYNPRNKKDEERVNAERDSIWEKHLHELCVGMNAILPGTSVNTLKERFLEGRKELKGGYQPYRGSITYQQYKKIQELPIINLGKKYSGCYAKEIKSRENFIGNTGNNVFGVSRNTEKNGRIVEEVSGLEKKYNGYLKGEAGIGTRAKVGGKWITTHEEKLPKDGYDVQTTLNAQMMDICHTALERELKEKSLAAGWAILMETKTGDIKAIVNLARNEKGEYTDSIGNKTIRFGTKDSVYVQKNQALCERNEPGSIFKTVALTAILADGKLTTQDSVIAYPAKVHNFSGHRVHDEMYRNNGTGKYSMSDAMMYSSNISLVQFVRNAYLNNPEQYTNTLKRFGFTDNYNLVDDEVAPYIKTPDTRGQEGGWDGYTLNSMAMGLAVEMTAINMVSFYNTIANGGRQMQPRLVKAILNNGKVIEKFPTKVINEQLFSKDVAQAVTAMLDSVVNGKSIIADKKDWRYGKRDGTGKNAHSELMRIAGKTGTAKQYASKKHPDGDKDKLLSFCGFFPADAPEYTLIVQIMYDYDTDPRPQKEKDSNSYGGGSTSALVFKEIAEKIMTDKLAIPVKKTGDKEVHITPAIKKGNIGEAYYLLNSIGAIDSIPKVEKGKEWGEITFGRNGKYKTTTKELGKVPDVTKMGAKEAIYLLQKHNFKVKIEGFGTVKKQRKKGDTIILELE